MIIIIFFAECIGRSGTGLVGTCTEVNSPQVRGPLSAEKTRVLQNFDKCKEDFNIVYSWASDIVIFRYA
jgi:hypothetical protein